MFWIDLAVVIIVLVDLALASFAAWLHWMFLKQSPPKDIHVLMLVNMYLVTSILTTLLLATVGSLIWSTGLYINLTAALVFSELTLMSVNMIFVLSVAMFVIKIQLTLNFDEMHDRDPQQVAHKALTTSLGVVVPPGIAITCYHLYNQEVVHKFSRPLMGTPEAPITGFNVSFLLFILNISLLLISFLAYKWSVYRYSYNKEDAIVTSVAVAGRRSSAPAVVGRRPAPVGEAAAKTAPPPTSKGFSMRHVVYGLAAFFVAVTIGLLFRMDNELGRMVRGYPIPLVWSPSITAATMYFSLTGQVRRMARQRWRQIKLSSRWADFGDQRPRSSKVRPTDATV